MRARVRVQRGGDVGGGHEPLLARVLAPHARPAVARVRLQHQQPLAALHLHRGARAVRCEGQLYIVFTYIFFCFTLYSAYDNVGRENRRNCRIVVLRYSAITSPAFEALRVELRNSALLPE